MTGTTTAACRPQWPATLSRAHAALSAGMARHSGLPAAQAASRLPPWRGPLKSRMFATNSCALASSAVAQARRQRTWASSPTSQHTAACQPCCVPIDDRMCATALSGSMSAASSRAMSWANVSCNAYFLLEVSSRTVARTVVTPFSVDPCRLTCTQRSGPPGVCTRCSSSTLASRCFACSMASPSPARCACGTKAISRASVGATAVAVNP